MRDRNKKTAEERLAGIKAFFQRYGDELLFAVALAILAAALFRPGTKAEQAVTQITAPRVTFTQWWGDDLQKDTLEGLIKEFESLHGIIIIPADMDYETLRLSLFNPGELPPGDVIALDPLWVPELVKRGTVEASNAPLLSFINVLYYNTEILKEAGFIRPPRNRSEFLAAAKAAREKGYEALAVDGKGSRALYDDIFPWIWAGGAPLIQDGKPALSAPSVRESLSFLGRLHKEGLISPAFTGLSSAASETKSEKFAAGKAAFMVSPAKDIRRVRTLMGESAFGITLVPPPDTYSGRPLFGTAAWSLGVYGTSPCKEEARLFIDFLKEKAPLLLESVEARPAGALSPGLDPFYSKVFDMAISGDNARDFGGVAEVPALEEIFLAELTALFNEETTAEEAAAAIQEKWSALIEAR